MKEGVELTCSKKKVVLEGCNGDWSQKRYLPFLAEKAKKGEIELWALDIEPQIRLSTSKVANLWRIDQNQNKAYYLDKIQNKQSYERLSDASYVFVVTPDRSHCEIAEFWLERLSRHGKIFIEKPLDASIRRARELKRKIGERHIVYGFNHYLGRAYPFLQHKDVYLEKIGQIKKIEFHILESSGIPLNRAKSLDKGVIFDLFSLALPLINAVLSLKCSPAAVKLEEVKAARYVNAPISGETFTWIKSHVGDVEVESVVGTCVGISDDKCMKIHGSKGQIKLDLLVDEFFIFDSQDSRKEQGNLNPKHVESFLEDILQGREPLSAPGVLSFDAAFEILFILDQVKKRIRKVSEYQAMEVTSEILKML